MEHNKYENMPDAVINLLKLPLKIALTSLAIGTFLLLLFFVAPDKDPVISTGIAYVIIALAINSIAFLIFIAFSFRHKAYQWDIIGRAGLMLINIPIAYLYFIIVVKCTIG